LNHIISLEIFSPGGVTTRTDKTVIDASTLGDKRLIFNININSLLSPMRPTASTKRTTTKVPKKQVTPQSTTKKPTTVTTKPTGITTTKKPTEQQLLKIALAKLQVRECHSQSNHSVKFNKIFNYSLKRRKLSNNFSVKSAN
jgi:hypothetical protein